MVPFATATVLHMDNNSASACAAPLPRVGSARSSITPPIPLPPPLAEAEKAKGKEKANVHIDKNKERVVKNDNGLRTLRYEEAAQGKIPIPVTVPPPRRPPVDLHPALRERRDLDLGEGGREGKRDSGLAPTTSSRGIGIQREGSVAATSIATASIGESPEEDNLRETYADMGAGCGLRFDFGSSGFNSKLGQGEVNIPKTPESKEERSGSSSNARTSVGSGGSMRRWGRSKSKKEREWQEVNWSSKKRISSSSVVTPKSIKSQNESQDAPRISEAQEPKEEHEHEYFSRLTTPIPSAGFLEDDFLDNMSFSKRGSIMFGGKKAVNGQLRFGGGRRQQSISVLASPTIKILSDDAEKESQKVRSMYEQGSSPLWENGQHSSMTQMMNAGSASEDPFMSNGLLSPGTPERPVSQLSFKQEHELAGGIEDWEDINGHDVDRYGFISKRRSDRPGTPEMTTPQRVSTALHLASETPRKKRGFGRSASIATSARSTPKGANRKLSARSLNTQASNTSQRSISRVRSITNHLPGNRDRRCMDEAGDMLTLPPGLADIAEDEDGGRAIEGMKKKEWERAEKWRKMAKVVKTGNEGEGMEFEFDVKSPKLIERTWKGIPDRWRSAAWYSFLASSASKRKDSPSEKDIIQAFHSLLKSSSMDDQQIDTDVPRTINSHIMFRKRYRGGQRLLFRVLHSLSLYFPETGYVQGMASLAATLLCYYDEERAFVMLVRMWTLRGLAKLYATGFGGLMAALEEFHERWMKGREVTQKLDDLLIEPTSYGTRWYLTLFGYSIPFPAQLRVWDVFMLLGDADPVPLLPRTISSPIPQSPNSPRSVQLTDNGPEVDFRGGLDVLHATSAALIDGTREILLDSDFENAMKVLTSWIPVKDEELLMKVAKAEWKLVKGKKR